MSKKILVCDPNGYCGRCPCRQYLGEESDESICGVTMKLIPEGVKLPEWCPLKDLPERLTGKDAPAEFIQGWNAAIDSIELG